MAGSVTYGYHVISQKFFFQNPKYFLHEITVESDGLFTRDEIVQLIGIQIGQSIFSVDCHKAEHTIQQLAQVENTKVQRRWPDRLVIRITPRTPLAWLASKTATTFSRETTYLVDRHGVIMRPEKVQPAFWQLPVIYCDELGPFLSKDRLATADLAAAVDLLVEQTLQPNSRLQIRSLDISKGYAVDVFTDQGASITFSPSQFREQFSRLEKLLHYCAETGRQLEFANLIPKRNTPVRFAKATTPMAVQRALPVHTNPRPNQ